MILQQQKYFFIFCMIIILLPYCCYCNHHRHHHHHQQQQQQQQQQYHVGHNSIRLIPNGGNIIQRKRQTQTQNKQHKIILADNNDDHDNNNNKEKGKGKEDTSSRNVVCSYVNYILNKRVEQIMNNQRSKWFTKHYRKKLDDIDSEYTIVSSHGRDVVSNDNNHNNIIIDNHSLIIHKNDYDMDTNGNLNYIKDNKVFPNNLLSLEMVYTNETYSLALKEIELKQNKEILDQHSMYTKEKLFIPKLCIRAIQLGINFTPVTLTMTLAIFSKSFRDVVWYNLLGRCLAKSGPAFIKWGQWASTRSDMFPDTLCQALSELHADAPAHSWKITQQTVEEALCIPQGTLFDVFKEFDHEPVASGSIAQVHRAVLRSPSMNEKLFGNNNNNHDIGGTTIAVKVRHPNVSRLIDMDFRLMSIIADIFDRIPSLSWLRIRESVEQFSHTMAAQAHLNVEAHHLEVLNYNFRNWDEVKFPTPLFACSSVIIETFEKGEICTSLIEKYDDLASSRNSVTKEAGNDDEIDDNAITVQGYELMPVRLSKFIVTTGLSLYLKMLLVDNLMHADLHPGNIMLNCQIVDERYGDISPLSNLGNFPVGGASSICETVETKSIRHNRQQSLTKAVKVRSGFYGQICLVDAGMVAQLNDDESTNFIGLISALGEGDGRAAAEAVMRFNNNHPHTNLTPDEKEFFIQDIITLFEERCQGYGTNVDFGHVLRGVLGVVKKHRIQLGANYATLVVNALCLDGLAKRVCPSYNLLDASKPLLKAHKVLPYNSDVKKSKRFFPNRPKLKRALIRAATPILYFKKRQNDDKFFEKIELQRKGALILRREQSQKRRLYRRVISVGTLACLAHHALSTLLANQGDELFTMIISKSQDMLTMINSKTRCIHTIIKSKYQDIHTMIKSKYQNAQPVIE